MLLLISCSYTLYVAKYTQCKYEIFFIILVAFNLETIKGQTGRSHRIEV